MSQADDPLLCWRPEFPISEETNYLISNSLGAMPRRARDSVAGFLDAWDRRGVRAWADAWWEVQFEMAGHLERILGVASGTVSMHQNVAMASQAILSCFDFDGPRNRVVYSDLNFPSVTYLYEAQRRRGAEIVRVPAADDGVTVDLQRLLEAIDDRTLLVPISHVLFRSSFIQDAAAIARRAREVGAFVILDVFQSIGAVPLALREWGVHAAVGGALKYLCGGAGNCFLYVDPDQRGKLEPTFTGWAAHRHPFDFRADGHDYEDGARRFLNGTPAVPAIYAGIEGVKIVGEIGVEAIRAKSVRITTEMVERCDQLGLAVHSPRDVSVRGNHLSVGVEHGYEVCQALLAEDILCDYRPGAGIRFSPHFYTTDGEALAALDRTAEILESGAYRPFVGAQRRPG